MIGNAVYVTWIAKGRGGSFWVLKAYSGADVR